MTDHVEGWSALANETEATANFCVAVFRAHPCPIIRAVGAAAGERFATSAELIAEFAALADLAQEVETTSETVGRRRRMLVDWVVRDVWAARMAARGNTRAMQRLRELPSALAVDRRDFWREFDRLQGKWATEMHALSKSSGDVQAETARSRALSPGWSFGALRDCSEMDDPRIASLIANVVRDREVGYMSLEFLRRLCGAS